MTASKLFRWVPKSMRRTAPARRLPALRLEGLDAREVPAAHTFTGSGSWNDAGNWGGGNKPVVGEVGDIFVTINSNSTMFQDIPGLVVDQLKFNNNGTSVLLLSKALGVKTSSQFFNLVNASGTNSIVGATGVQIVGGQSIGVELDAGTLTVSASISGTGGLLLGKGGGTLELTQPNTYTGVTTVQSGSLKLNNTNSTNSTLPATSLVIGNGDVAPDAFVSLATSAQLPNGLSVTVASDGQFNMGGQAEGIANLTLNGGRVATGGGNLIVSGDITANDDSTIDVGGANSTGVLTLTGGDHTINVADTKTLTIKTQIAGAGGIVKDKAGTLAFENKKIGADANSYTGQTWVKAGTLTLNDQAPDSAFKGNLMIGTGTAASTAAFVKLLAINEIPNNATVTIASDGQFDLNGHVETIGALNLAGGAGVVGNSTLALNGDVTLAGGKAIPAVFLTNLSLGGGDRKFMVGDVVPGTGSDLLVYGALSSGNLILDGAGTTDLGGTAGTPSTLGTTTLKNGTLLLSDNGASENISGSLIIGDGDPNNGLAVVKLSKGEQLADNTVVAVYADGTLDLANNTESIGAMILAGGTVDTGSATLILGGDVTAAAALTTSKLIGNFSLGSADRTFTVSDGPMATDLLVTGRLLGQATTNFIKDGAGTMEIAGPSGGTPNTFGGKTWAKAGTLVLNDNDSNTAVSATIEVGNGNAGDGAAVLRLGQPSEIPDDAVITVHGDGTFDLAAHSDTIGSLVLGDAGGGGTVTGTVGFQSGLRLAGNITTNASPTPSSIGGKFALLTGAHSVTTNGDLRIDAAMAGDGSVVKAGTGTLTLTATNTYTGATTVNAGSLVVDGSSPASPISLTAGSLKGSGTVGSVTTTGGSVSPGNSSTAALHTGDLKLAGATFVAELAGPAVGQHDQLVVVGGVDLTGASLNKSASFTPAAGQQFKIIDNDKTDAVVGTFSGLAEGATFTLAGRPFKITYAGGDGNDVVLIENTPNAAPTISDVANQSSTGSPVGPVGFTVNDAETPAASLTVAATSNNPTLLPNANIQVGGSGSNRTVTVTPAAGQSGTATITITVTDAAGAVASDTFTLTVTLPPPNTPPTVSDVGNQTSTGAAVGPIGFTVGDAQTPAASLTVSATSSNPTLVPTGNIALGGSGANRTVTVTPVAGKAGTATITLTVTDASGATATDTFDVVITPPVVNTFPTISDVQDQSSTGAAIGPVGFLVSDLETPAGNLTVTASSSNPTLVPPGSIALGGSGPNRTILVSPAAGQTGTATITLTVTDAAGGVATDTFVVTVTADPGNDGGGGSGKPIAPKEFAVGADRGGSGVTLFNPDGSPRYSLTPFGEFTGGIRTAAADFTGDGIADLVAGTGVGVPTRVVVLDGVTQKEVFAVDPFESSFLGGVFVAAGDINGDGKPELVISPDEGGGPRVRVFDGNGFGQMADFFGIDDPAFRGGARAAVGDIDGDGKGDLVVAAGFGGGPRLAAFGGAGLKSDGGPKLFPDFFAFESTLRNGVYITAGDIDGDGKAEVIGGGGPGGGPRVSVFAAPDLLKGQQTRIADFFAGDSNNRGGVRLAVKDLDGDTRADIVTGDGNGARVKGYAGTAVAANGNDPAAALSFDAFSGFAAGVFVG